MQSQIRSHKACSEFLTHVYDLVSGKVEKAGELCAAAALVRASPHQFGRAFAAVAC